MNKREGHIDYELIARFLSGNASEEDKESLQIWLDSQPDNAEELKRIREIWSRSGHLYETRDEKVDIESAWTSVGRRTGILKDGAPSLDTSRRTSLFYITRIAATVF